MSLELHRKDGCAFLTQVELCFNVLASVCLMWCKIQLQAGQHTGDESVQRKVCGISCGKVKSISKDLTLQEQKITCSVTTACSLFLIIRRKADLHSKLPSKLPELEGSIAKGSKAIRPLIGGGCIPV